MHVRLSAPHTPWLPTKRFEGKTSVSDYGDFVLMVDVQYAFDDVDQVAAMVAEWDRRQLNVLFLETPLKMDDTEKIEALVPSIAAGDFKVSIAEQFPLTTEGVRAAHAMMGSNQNIGKIVLRVREDDAKL